MASRDPLVERMRGFGTTIFAEMSALAVQTGSVNLGQGFPDTDGPSALLDAAAEAIRTGHNQYPPGPGIPELRRAIAAHQQRYYGTRPSTPTPRCSSPPAPPRRSPPRCWRSPARATRSSCSSRTTTPTPRASRSAAPRRRTGHAAARRRRRGRSTRTALRAAITPRTQGDPAQHAAQPDRQGVHPRRAGDHRRRWPCEHDLVVIADEVYEHLTFDGRSHVPIATLPGMRERTVTIWQRRQDVQRDRLEDRLGLRAAAAVTAVRTVKQFLTYVNGAPFQPAVAQRARRRRALRRHCAAASQQQRDLLCDGLARTRLRRRASRRRPTSRRSTSAATRSRSAASCPRAPASSRSRAASSTTRRPATTLRPIRVLQAPARCCTRR